MVAFYRHLRGKTESEQVEEAEARSDKSRQCCFNTSLPARNPGHTEAEMWREFKKYIIYISVGR